MKNDWILDVLSDLTVFARSNGLTALAAQLADTADLAAIELAAKEQKAGTAHGNDFAVGLDTSRPGESRRA